MSALHAAAPSAGRWLWPVTPPRVVAGFSAPPTPYAAGHRGIDVATTNGQTVVAPAAGIVRFAGVVVDRPVVTLEHDGALFSIEPVASTLRPGDPVSRGVPVGTVAAGGHCADLCVHLGVRVEGSYVSPLLFFGRVPHSVLLPVTPR